MDQAILVGGNILSIQNINVVMISKSLYKFISLNWVKDWDFFFPKSLDSKWPNIFSLSPRYKVKFILAGVGSSLKI